MAETFKGQIVDLIKREIFPGSIRVAEGRITEVSRLESAPEHYIIPGLVDSHVHIESSMLTPANFGRAAVTHGSVAALTDPHEIANVLGMRGIDYMLDDAQKSAFKFFFGAPSCVPATGFETAGAELDAAAVEELLARDEICFLSEMMNFPGVIHNDESVMQKIACAKALHKPVDGHAPGLSGAALKKYVDAGITTDHEAFTYAEALEKIELGMKIQIREGSAAKNFSDLLRLIDERPEMCMFCSDDKHPDDLIQGHINLLVQGAIRAGCDPLNVLTCACLTPIKHYHLDVGLLQAGDAADFIIVNNLANFDVLQTYIDGELVAENGQSLLPPVAVEPINPAHARSYEAAEFTIQELSDSAHVIEVFDGQLITGHRIMNPAGLLKIAVCNRYHEAPPMCGYVTGFELQEGAIAGSVAHDSHNIIAIGSSSEYICRAVNLVSRGGLAVVGPEKKLSMELPVAGLISTMDAWQTAAEYAALDSYARQLVRGLRAPFMTLSFMALPVIPSLKITDKGLFDVEQFSFIELFD